MSTEHKPANGPPIPDSLETRSKQAFDASVRSLDASTRSRLTRARMSALEAATSGGVRDIWPRAGAAIGVAAALALAVVVLPQQPSVTPTELTAFDDLDILLDEDELELFEELDFYAWLDEQPEIEQVSDDSDGTG